MNRIRWERAQANSRSGDVKTGNPDRLDHDASPGPDHRFTVSKSGRYSLHRNDGTAQWHLSRATMGTNVHLGSVPALALRRGFGGLVMVGSLPFEIFDLPPEVR